MQEISLQDILQRTSELKEKKVGYVAIIGRPNTGKSTFINTILEEKVSIVTHIPQTTRKKVLGIYNDQDSQIIFFDTPGIHESEKIFNSRINEQALSSLKDADIILFFLDSSRKEGKEDQYIEKILENISKPIFRVYTKRDMKEERLIPTGKNIYEISSLNYSGIPELLSDIKTLLSTGPILFPEDFYTKQDIYFRISEIIREKLFFELEEEIPHSVFVGVEDIEDQAEKNLKKISAYIYTESDSQKYIVIGKGGNLLTRVGKAARLELEYIFGMKVFLSLRVKVKKNWRKDENFIKNMMQ